MQWIIFKYAITAEMVVLISEIAKRSDKLGGLINSLHMVGLLFNLGPLDGIAPPHSFKRAILECQSRFSA